MTNLDADHGTYVHIWSLFFSTMETIRVATATRVFLARIMPQLCADGHYHKLPALTSSELPESTRGSMLLKRRLMKATAE